MEQLTNFTVSAVLNNYSKNEYGDLYFDPGLQIITDFKNGKSSLFSTYDEHLNLSENGQATLSFKMIYKNNEQTNPFLSLTTIGRELQLYWEEKYYYFVITSRTPDFKKDNIEFSFSCQDSFSYFLSHNNIDANFKEEDISDFNYTGRSIQELMKMVLTKSNLGLRWQLDSRLSPNASGQALFPNSIYGDTRIVQETTATLDLTGSNTYNAFVEIANIFNGTLEVIYNKNPSGPHYINVINKNYPVDSYHRLQSSVNLNRFNLSEDGKEFCSVLFVSGGKDSEDNYVSIVPTITDNLLAVYDYFFRTTPAEAIKKPLLGENGELELYNDHLEHINAEINDASVKKNKIVYNEADNNFLKTINTSIKTASSMLYNFDYFLKTGQMSKEVYDNLNRLLNFDYRNENLKIQIYSKSYYKLLRDYNEALYKEEDCMKEIAIAYQEKINCYVDSSQDNNVIITNSEENGLTIANDDSAITSITMSSIKRKNSIESRINNLYVKLLDIWANNYVEPFLRMGYNIPSEKPVTGSSSLFFDKRYAEAAYDKEIKEKNYIKTYDEMISLVKDMRVPVFNKTTKTLVFKRDDEIDSSALETLLRKLREKDFSIYTRYCTLKNRLESYVPYLDKEVQTETLERIYCPGYYTILMNNMQKLSSIYHGKESDSVLTQIKAIYNDFVSYGNTEINYVQLMRSAEFNKNEIWKKIIEKYGRYIIEGHFSDESQLDGNGLYSKAISQFVKYSSPNLNYSAEMLDWNLITEDAVEPVKIGDLLTIDYHNVNLFNADLEKDTSAVVRFYTQKYVGAPGTINGLSISRIINSTTNPSSNIRSIESAGSGNTGTRYYVDIKFNFLSGETPIVDYSFIKLINNIKVESLEIIKNDKSILLSVSGIDRNLRENVCRLSVSNAFAMSSVVQKMLLQVRF